MNVETVVEKFGTELQFHGKFQIQYWIFPREALQTYRETKCVVGDYILPLSRE
jgi:hypothetical protein